MAITKEITKDHVLAALEFIDKNGVPTNNESNRYDLVVQNDGGEKRYPPKYVIAVARHIATNGDVSTSDFTAIDAKKYLERLKFSIADRKTFELTISSSGIVSTDNRFTMDNISLGDNYQPVNAYFNRADGLIIRRDRKKHERKISNQTLPSIACQVFQTQLSALSKEEKAAFPICKYKPRSEVIRGIYPTVEDFTHVRKSFEYMVYDCEDGTQFVFYSWNVFSTLFFVQECLKRFGTEGDKFVLVYKEKDRDELTDGKPEIPLDANTGVANVIDHDEALAAVPVDTNGKPLPPNLIYFGAPGTGKSHQLKESVEGILGEDGNVIQNGIFVDVDEDKKIVKRRYERVTFYPTYSYAQFVGCYKPVMEQSREGLARNRDVLDLTLKQLSDKLKEKLASAKESKRRKTNEEQSITKKSVAILLFAEQFYDNLVKLNKQSRKKILSDAGATTDYDRADLENGIKATEFRRSFRSTTAGDESIAYKFVPGPFLRILVRALNDPKNNYCLVIEEINRANAAAVFGDVFQLLDRPDGISEYDVAASEDVKKYLKVVVKSDWGRKFLGMIDKNGKEVFGEDATMVCRLRIPSNMYIWATMNSADQGVFPMDTAFKRRWKFKYFEINQSDDKIKDRKIGTDLTIDGKSVYTESNWSKLMKDWNNVRKFVNRLLSLFKVNEDKLMGPWFVQPESGDVISAEQFESKVLMYLWEDAARMCRQKMFPPDVTSYSELIAEWRGRGVGIFEHLMGDNQIGGKDQNSNNPNSATELWGKLKKALEKQP